MTGQLARPRDEMPCDRDRTQRIAAARTAWYNALAALRALPQDASAAKLKAALRAAARTARAWHHESCGEFGSELDDEE